MDHIKNRDMFDMLSGHISPTQQKDRHEHMDMFRASMDVWQDTGLSLHLELTETHLIAVSQLDPNFSTESAALTRRVQEDHSTLSHLVEDSQADNEVVLEQLETFIAARSHLEQRTIDHILLIRHLLTSQQKQQLQGLCMGRAGH